MRIIARFFKDNNAATAVEYALIASAIAIAIVASVNGVGTTLGSGFMTINTSLK